MQKSLNQLLSAKNNNGEKIPCQTSEKLKTSGFYVGQVEIGTPGSEVKVDELQWATAISKPNPVHMIKTLLPALFDLDVLLNSNYKGGAPKNKDNSVQKKRLDPKIIEALKYTVNKMYPGQMSDSAFGQAINSKITSLRHKVVSQEKVKPKDVQD